MLTEIIILQVITFAALAFLLRILFHRHLNSALKRLKAMQYETALRENQLKEELEKAKKDRIEEKEKGKKEAAELVDDTKKQIELMRLSAEEDAKQQNKKVFAHGQEELERLKARMISDIEARALEISIDLISHTFNQKGREDLQRQFIDDLIEEIAHVERSKFSVKTNKARVLTSFPLSEKERERLKKVLSARMGHNITITEEVKPELITGLVVQLDALEIDGSLKNRLRKALPLLKR